MKHSLTSGSIWRGMLFFALPILLGNIFQQLYNTADAFIVGRFLDKNAYAAVSSSGSPASTSQYTLVWRTFFSSAQM